MQKHLKNDSVWGVFSNARQLIIVTCAKVSEVKIKGFQRPEELFGRVGYTHRLNQLNH